MAFKRALTGLSMVLITRLKSTSPMPLGGAVLPASAAACRVRVVGKRKEKDTPMMEARKVLVMYRVTMGFMLPFWFGFFWAMALMTRKNTSTGATLFNAFTKRSPNTVRKGTDWGRVTASRMPSTSPRAIW